MNSKERVMAALTGKSFDRRPWYGLLSLYGANLIQCDLETYYTDATQYAAGQEAVVEQVPTDIVFGPFALPILGEAFGGQLRYLKDQAPNLASPPFSALHEINADGFPDIDAHPRLVYFRKSIQLLHERLGEHIPIAAISLSPFDLPIMILGLENWLYTLITADESELEALLNLTMTFCTTWANALLSDGADCILLPCPFTTPAIITHELAEVRAMPVLHQFISRVEGPVILHNGGTAFSNFVDLFNDLPTNMMGVVLDSQDDFDNARRTLGPDITLFGGIDGPTLKDHSIGSLKKQSSRLLAQHATDTRYVFGTSGADVALDTPLTLLQTLGSLPHE